MPALALNAFPGAPAGREGCAAMKDASAELRLHLVASMAEPCRRDAFDDPLDMIVADHYRIRAMLGLASILARGRASPRVREITARALLAFLRVDLDRHLADEEAHFFPMLEQRLAPSDLLDPSLRQMAVQHASMRASATLLAEEFARVAEDPAPPPSARLRRCVAEFAQAKHRHIAIENAMVLPLARARLTPRDWSVLGRGLAARRFAAVAR